jgi:hypothetical protein
MNQPAPQRHIVGFVHGIHNAADNYGDIYSRWAFEHARSLHVEQIDWGWITGVQMWLAGVIPALDWRRQRYIARQLRAARNCFGEDVPLSVIAHSKGTDLIVDTLLANEDIELEALVLVGSVLGNRFAGSKIQTLLQLSQVRRVLVVWSPNDSIIRNLSIWPYGKLGCTGFTDLSKVQGPTSKVVFQVETAEEHSTYFWSEFRDQHFRSWTDFILGRGVN